MTIGISTNSELLEAFQTLNDRIQDLVKVKTFDHQPAIEAANRLAALAFQYRNEVCQPPSNSNQQITVQHLKGALVAKHITFPAVWKLIDALATPELQFDHVYIHALAKSARIFIELFVAQNRPQRMRQTTSDSLRGTLRDIIQVIPKEEVECRFELKCCRAALKKAPAGKHVALRIGKKHAQPVAMGVMSSIVPLISKDPGMPDVSAALGPVIDLIKDVYKELPELWYRDIWALRWQTLALPIKTIKIYESFEKNFQKFWKDYRMGLFLTQLFSEIIEDKDAEEDLKSHVLRDKKVSLITFASAQFADEYDSFWKVRLVALTYLRKLSNPPPVKIEDAKSIPVKVEDVRSALCRDVVIGRYKDKHEDPDVRSTARSIIVELAEQGYKDELQNRLKEHQAKLRKKDPIQDDITTLNSELDKLEQMKTSSTRNESAGAEDNWAKIERAIIDVRKEVDAKKSELSSIEFEETALSEIEELLKTGEEGNDR